MASNKKNHKRPVKAAPVEEQRSKAKNLLFRVMAVVIAALMLLGIVITAAFSSF